MLQTLESPIWERQRGETNDWYYRFGFFVRQGPERSIEQAWRNWKALEAPDSKAKRPNPSWYRFAERYRWKERAEAYDLEQRRLQAVEEQQAKEEMLLRHREEAKQWQVKAMDALSKLAIRDVRTALQAWKEGLAVERQNYNLPREILEVAALSDEELSARYQEIIKALTGAGSYGEAAGSFGARSEEEEPEAEEAEGSDDQSEDSGI